MKMSNEKASLEQQQQQQEQQITEEEEQGPPSVASSLHASSSAGAMSGGDEDDRTTEQAEEKMRQDIVDPEGSPSIRTLDKEDVQGYMVEEEESSPAPPPLVRMQARQLSRVGAVAISGMNASITISSPSCPSVEDEGETRDIDEENPPMTALEATISTSTAATEASGVASIPDVMATLVTDAEYEAELQRAIMRTAVRASKVETEEEHEPQQKFRPLMFACFALIFMVIVASALYVFLSAPSTRTSSLEPPPETSGNFPLEPTDREGIEEVIDVFLKSRSFDGGEALKKYASPQRTALRYIAAEFPQAPLDEKLIDLYAVATFFFSTSGTFWTNNTKWKSGDPVCIWHGIGCDDAGVVISISLANNNLRGSLPPELGLLTQRQVDGEKSTLGLTKLDLSFNRIEGNIPEEVSLLTSMEEFNLRNNVLSGNIPAGISNWTNLEYASFANNNVRGEISESLCQQNDMLELSVDCSTVQCSCCTPSCVSIGRGPSEADPEEKEPSTRATISPTETASTDEIETTSPSEEDDSR